MAALGRSPNFVKPAFRALLPKLRSSAAQAANSSSVALYYFLKFDRRDQSQMTADPPPHHFPFGRQRDLDKPNAPGRQGEGTALPLGQPF
jgi:hypothetical protein